MRRNDLATKIIATVAILVIAGFLATLSSYFLLLALLALLLWL